MLATVKAALAEAEAWRASPAERIAAAISFGALMGARGNWASSLSQIFRGMAEGWAGRAGSTVSTSPTLTPGADRMEPSRSRSRARS